MKRIYLDTCIWCRSFDEPSPRIDAERKAFLSILRKAYEEKFSIIGSILLDIEVEKVKGEAKRKAVENSMLKVIPEKIEIISESISSKKREVQRLGLKDMDAYHLACAIESKAEYLISVNDEILKKGKESEEQHKIVVCDPIEFLRRENNGN